MEATGDLIDNKIVNYKKITTKYFRDGWKWNKNTKERYISPEEREQIIRELRLTI